MAVNLTRDAIAMVTEGNQDIKPVLQVYEVKLVMSQAASERYRLVLSDGVHYQQSMLASQLNHYVKSGQLEKGSIVQMMEYICNTIQNRKIIIVINLEVVLQKCELIGEPQPYKSGSGNPPGISGIQTNTDSIAPKSSPVQSRPVTVNPQSYGGSYGSVRPGEGLNHGVATHQPKNEPGTNVSGFGNTSKNYLAPQNNPMNQNQQMANTYGRPHLQSTYQQPPSYVNRGPIAKNEAPARIIPIAALNPYQGRWTIKARVTSKGDLRRYTNPRGEGKVFSFDLLDSEGGEIRVTCFNLVADQFYDRVDIGKVYLISKGSLKPAQKSFNHLNNEWEIFLESTSTIDPCPDEDSSIPKQQFNFRPISEIESLESNSMADLIGVVVAVNPSSTIMRKNGTETQKRAVQIKDMSGRSVELTIWGNFCNVEGQQLQEMCDSGSFPILAVKAGRVNDFNGKSVGTITSSQLFINPDFPEAHRLREWFAREGKNMATPSISKDSSGMGRTDVRKTVSQIKDEGLGRSEKPDWITVKAIVAFVKVDNFCYTACPLMVGDRQCNKKVVNNGDGRWHCDRCDQDVAECDYRYLLQFQIQDHSGITWVTAFQEAGEDIMGVKAKDLYMLKHEEHDDVEFGKIIKTVLFNQYLFKLKVKEEMFSDEQRVKSTVVKAERLNFAAEGKHLLGSIQRLSCDEQQTLPPTAAPYTRNNFGYDNKNSGVGYGGNPPVSNSSFTNGNDNKYLGGINYGSNPLSSNAGVKKNEGYRGSGGGGGYSFGGNGGGGSYNSSFCNKCGGNDHNSMNCPGPQRSNSGSGIGSYGSRLPNAGGFDGGAAGGSKCFKCNQSGHWARDCPGQNAPTVYGSSGPGGYGGTRANSYGGRF